MDYDIKTHLGFIQVVINKNREYSANCKKSALMIFFASSFFTSLLKFPVDNMISASIMSMLMYAILVINSLLWYFDAEYERTAQMYHKLYDAVRLDEGKSISPYDMSIAAFDVKNDYLVDLRKFFAVIRVMFITWKNCCLYLFIDVFMLKLAKFMSSTAMSM